MPIQSFADKATELFFKTGKPGKVAWTNVKSVAQRKLDMVDYAAKLDDLKVPPGNRLKTLSGRLAGKHSIRINDQWRIVFRWTDAGPVEVEIVDYH
jgi:toxin HigB-1